MESVFALAPPMSLPERLIVACLGFALACILARLVVGTFPTTVRMLISLCAALVVVAGSSLLADDRSILAFFAGALGGAIAVPHSARFIAPSVRRFWRLPVACLILGPALGIVLFVVTQFNEYISPLDRLYYFRVSLAVGSLAGLLSAAVVSTILACTVQPRA